MSAQASEPETEWKQRISGIRLTVIRLLTISTRRAALNGFREAEELVRDYDGAFDGRIHILLGPTQSMTCTPAMLQETRKVADKLGVGITVHVAEDLAEFEGCVRLHGKTPVELLYDTGCLGEDVVLAHCVFISGHSQVFIKDNRDMKLLGKTKSNVAHSPTPFIRVGTNLESFGKYAENGVNMGIGTDTFPSDMVQEMRLAAFMAKSQEENDLQDQRQRHFQCGYRKRRESAGPGGSGQALCRRDGGLFGRRSQHH